MKVDFETVWERIKTHQGDRFTTIKGKIFTYEISGDVFIVQENRNSRPQKSQFSKKHLNGHHLETWANLMTYGENLMFILF